MLITGASMIFYPTGVNTTQTLTIMEHLFQIQSDIIFILESLMDFQYSFYKIYFLKYNMGEACVCCIYVLVFHLSNNFIFVHLYM